MLEERIGIVTPCSITFREYGSRCRVYLNLNKGIVVHPYDDRGMDVIILNTSALARMYERHHELLLDYDIDAMQQTFAPS